MNELHFRLDPDRITIDDMIHFETHERSWEWIAGMLARMARDEHGVPLAYDDAIVLVRRLTLPQANQAIQQIFEQVSLPKVSDTA